MRMPLDCMASGRIVVDMNDATQTKATETDDEPSEFGYLTDEQYEMAEEAGYYD